jgi:hypothetical protein
MYAFLLVNSWLQIVQCEVRPRFDGVFLFELFFGELCACEWLCAGDKISSSIGRGKMEFLCGIMQKDFAFI